MSDEAKNAEAKTVSFDITEIVQTLAKEVTGLLQLRKAVHEVLQQEFDDICWMDVYKMLGKHLGIEFEPKMLPRPVMLKNCEKFVDSLLGGCPYKPEYQIALTPNQVNIVRFLLQAAQLGNLQHPITGESTTAQALVDERANALWVLYGTPEFKELARVLDAFGVPIGVPPQ